MNSVVPIGTRSEQVPTCGAEAAQCRCLLAPGHEGPHTCPHSECGGQWTGTDPNHVPVRMPGAFIGRDPLAFLFGGWSDEDES